MNIDVTCKQLAFFAEKYNCDINNIMIGIINGKFYVWEYDEYAEKMSKILEIIST